MAFSQALDSCTVSDRVERLVDLDGTYYSFGELESSGPERDGTVVLARFEPVSNQWQRVGEVPETAVEMAAEDVSLPLTKCVGDDSPICYRIAGEEKVLISEDGGESWKTGWKVPAGRELFMVRAADFCSGRILMGPYDLIVSGSEENHQVVAALGNEGVVMRKSDGSWERQAVINARPTPYRATSLLEVLVIIPTELASWLLFVWIYGVVQYLYFMRKLRFIFPPLTTAFLIFMTGGLMLAYGILDSGQVLEWGLLLLVCVTYCLPIYLAYRKWASESYKLDNPEKSVEAGRLWMFSTMGLFFGGIILLAFWPLGLIPFYWLMGLLVLGLALGVAWWSSNRIHLLMSEA